MSTRANSANDTVFLPAIRRGMLFLLLLMCAVGHSAAYRVPRIDRPPRLDGRLDDACWKTACRITSFHLLGTPWTGQRTKEVPATTAFLAYDRDALYVAFDCAEPLAAQMRTPDRPHDGPTWKDDGVELFFDPAGERRRYVQIAVNTAGVIMDGIVWKPGTPLDFSWETGAAARTHVGKNAWTVEVRIPFAGLPLVRPSGPWTFHVARNRRVAGQHLTALHASVNGYHETSRFDLLEGIDLPERDVCVQDVTFGELLAGTNLCRVRLKNFGKQPRTVRITAGVDGATPPRGIEETVTLGPSAEKSVVLPWRLLPTDAGAVVTLTVRRGNLLLHRRVRTIAHVPEILGEPARRVFFYSQGRTVRLETPVNLAEGSRRGTRLEWQAFDAGGACVGDGLTTIAERAAVLRLYWTHWYPGWYTIRLRLTRDGREIARREYELRFVENPWGE